MRAHADRPVPNRIPLISMQLLGLLLYFPPLVAAFSSSLPDPPVFLPTSEKAMIKQAASAVSSALLNDGIHLQTLRLPLSESMYSESEEGFVADRAIGWQGGPQETYRFLSPIVRQVLQSTATTGESPSGLLARVQEQILLDFDGSALLTSESPSGPLGDAQALLQPNTDAYYPKIIKSIEAQLAVKDPETNQNVNRLFLLVNPAWRDASSFGFFAAKQAQKDILDRYKTTYAVDQFVVRGQKCSVLKVWPHDWCVFAANLPYDSGREPKVPTFLGSFPERPPYEVIDDLVRRALEGRNAR